MHVHCESFVCHGQRGSTPSAGARELQATFDFSLDWIPNAEEGIDSWQFASQDEAATYASTQLKAAMHLSTDGSVSFNTELTRLHVIASRVVLLLKWVECLEDALNLLVIEGKSKLRVSGIVRLPMSEPFRSHQNCPRLRNEFPAQQMLGEAVTVFRTKEHFLFVQRGSVGRPVVK